MEVEMVAEEDMHPLIALEVQEEEQEDIGEQPR